MGAFFFFFLGVRYAIARDTIDGFFGFSAAFVFFVAVEVDRNADRHAEAAADDDDRAGGAARGAADRLAETSTDPTDRSTTLRSTTKSPGADPGAAGVRPGIDGARGYPAGPVQLPQHR